MKRNRWLALVLTILMLLGTMPRAVLAQELNAESGRETALVQEESADTSAPEQEEPADTSAPEQEESADGSAPEQEEPGIENDGESEEPLPEENTVQKEMEVPPQSAEETGEESGEETRDENEEAPQETEEAEKTPAAALPGVITGFAGQGSVCTLTLSAEKKPSQAELLKRFPHTISVMVNGKAGTIPVEWFCAGDEYESSSAYYFQFSPRWDEERWSLAEGLDLLTQAPYCSVFLTEGELVALSDSAVEVQCYQFLTKTMGLNTAAACGVMANIYSESAFKPNNLEQTYEKKLGYTDESYTAAVDNGTYKNFVKDSAGYGLVQLTWWTLKRDYLAYAQKKGVSIGDAQAQLEFLQIDLGTSRIQKLQSFPNTAQGAYDAGAYFCKYYERPSDTDARAKTRGNLAKGSQFWEKYKSAAARAESGVPDALSAPALLGIANTDKGVRLSWGGVAGAQKYRVFRSQGSESWNMLGESEETAWTDTTAQSGKSYRYTVRCLNSKGDAVSGFDANGLSITCWLPPSITGMNNTDQGIRLIWSNAGSSHYLLYRKERGGKWDEPVLVSSTSYIDTSVKPGVQYVFTVRCASDKGKPLSKYILSAPIVCLSAPAITSAANVSDGIQLRWNETKGAGGYLVYRRSGSGSWRRLATLKGQKTLSYVDKTVEKKNGLAFGYMVRAYRGTTLSGYHPAGMTMYRLSRIAWKAVQGRKGSFTAKWKKNSKVQGYQLYWTRGKTKGRVTVRGSGRVGAVVRGLKKGTYTLRVRGWRRVGNATIYSAWSGAKKVKAT